MQRIIHCRVFEGEIASILTEIVSQKKCDYSLLKKSFNSKKQNNFVLKKMKQIGHVEVPSEAFLTVLSTDEIKESNK